MRGPLSQDTGAPGNCSSLASGGCPRRKEPARQLGLLHLYLWPQPSLRDLRPLATEHTHMQVAKEAGCSPSYWEPNPGKLAVDPLSPSPSSWLPTPLLTFPSLPSTHLGLAPAARGSRGEESECLHPPLNNLPSLHIHQALGWGVGVGRQLTPLPCHTVSFLIRGPAVMVRSRPHAFAMYSLPQKAPPCHLLVLQSSCQAPPTSGKPSRPTSPFSSLFPSHPEADHSTQPPELRCLPDPTNPRASPMPGTQEALRTLEGLWVGRTQLRPSKPSPLCSGTEHGQFFCFVFSTWGSQQRHKPRF